jgi:hypothetical protein
MCSNEHYRAQKAIRNLEQENAELRSNWSSANLAIAEKFGSSGVFEKMSVLYSATPELL